MHVSVISPKQEFCLNPAHTSMIKTLKKKKEELRFKQSSNINALTLSSPFDSTRIDLSIDLIVRQRKKKRKECIVLARIETRTISWKRTLAWKIHSVAFVGPKLNERRYDASDFLATGANRFPVLAGKLLE